MVAPPPGSGEGSSGGVLVPNFGSLIDQLQTQVANNPQDVNAAAELASMELANGQTSQAAQLVGSLPPSVQSDPSLALVGDEARLQAGHMSALPGLAQLLQSHPDSTGFVAMGEALARSGDTGGAVSAFANASALDPSSAAVTNALGKALQQSRQQGQAIPQIPVVVDGQVISMDQAPVIQQGRTLAPMRAIAQSLGAQVSWDPTTQAVTATLGNRTVQFTIGSNDYTVNGQQQTLDVPASIVGGRTMLPVRAFAEAFGQQVQWNSIYDLVVVSGLSQPSTGSNSTGSSG